MSKDGCTVLPAHNFKLPSKICYIDPPDFAARMEKARRSQSSPIAGPASAPDEQFLAFFAPGVAWLAGRADFDVGPGALPSAHYIENVCTLSGCLASRRPQLRFGLWSVCVWSVGFLLPQFLRWRLAALRRGPPRRGGQSGPLQGWRSLNAGRALQPGHAEPVWQSWPCRRRGGLRRHG